LGQFVRVEPFESLPHTGIELVPSRPRVDSHGPYSAIGRLSPSGAGQRTPPAGPFRNHPPGRIRGTEWYRADQHRMLWSRVTSRSERRLDPFLQIVAGRVVPARHTVGRDRGDGSVSE